MFDFVEFDTTHVVVSPLLIGERCSVLSNVQLVVAESQQVSGLLICSIDFDMIQKLTRDTKPRDFSDSNFIHFTVPASLRIANLFD